MESTQSQFVYWCRVACVTAAVASGIAVGTVGADGLFAHDSFPAFASVVALVAVLTPVAVVVVVAIQRVNPVSDRVWERPSHRSNPLHLGNPLLFIHFASYMVIASGSGYLIAAIWAGTSALIMGATATMVGGGMFIGLRLSIWLLNSWESSIK